MREKVAQNIYYDREKKTYIVYFNYGKDPSGTKRPNHSLSSSAL